MINFISIKDQVLLAIRIIFYGITMHEKFELQLTAYDLSQARGRLRCRNLLFHHIKGYRK